MARTITNDLAELVEADVITGETASKIERYFQEKEKHAPNKMFTLFAVLGAVFVGLGIILIVAHNWDELPRSTKTIFAFIPLVIGQILALFVMFRKMDQSAWRESVAAFVFLAVGACIALISQIYNIPGDLRMFMLTWMVLCFPLIYLLKSSMASIFLIAGVTFYAANSSYYYFASNVPYLYIPLLAVVIPHYLMLIKNNKKSPFLFFHHWMIPLSLTISLGAFSHDLHSILFVSYFSFFALLTLLGRLSYFEDKKLWVNSCRVIGGLGTIILLLIFSFKMFWERLYRDTPSFDVLVKAPEFYTAILVSLAACIVAFYIARTNRNTKTDPFHFTFLLFIVLFSIRYLSPVFSQAVMNVVVLLLAIITIRRGVYINNLAVINWGLLIIATLVICRFFDTQLTFVTRGILFLLVGLGFFVTNYWMLKVNRVKARQ
jgi:uncharacterized membrane protein